MEKCCRWCHNYDNLSKCCNHEDMFTIEETKTGNDIMNMNLIDEEDGYRVNEISFRVKNPEEFSCCYWE